MSLLSDVKLALRLTTDAYDSEIDLLIDAGIRDLGFADVVTTAAEVALDPTLLRAVISYCRLNFGTPDPSDYDRMKKAYDEQKAQLQSATGYGIPEPEV